MFQKLDDVSLRSSEKELDLLLTMQKLNPSYRRKQEMEAIEKEKEKEKEREKQERKNHGKDGFG